MSSKKYKNYTQSDMTNALINIKCRRMSVMNASKMFKIPHRTLYNRIKKTFCLHADKQQTEEYTTNIESFLEPEIIIEEKPYPYLIIKTESISEETIIKIDPKIEEKLKITHEIDILERQIEDDQIKNKSELLRQLFLLKLASK